MAGVHKVCPVCGAEAWDDAALPCGYTSTGQLCCRRHRNKKSGLGTRPPAVKRDLEEDWKKIVRNRRAYMSIGDLDKPFHRPECACPNCEKWRVDKGRPTHKELREMEEPP